MVYHAARADAEAHPSHTLLCFNDDGAGHSPTEAVAMLCQEPPAQPGGAVPPLLAYGGRLAAAAFRLCNDVVFLTKVGGCFGRASGAGC